MYRWGIIGTGYAANEFASGLSQLADAEITGVASQTESRAEQFAGKFGVRDHYGSYVELIDRADLDVVYVGTVAPRHHDLCMRAIAAGKAVLCEKPFAMNAQQASEIACAARESGVFCMEAMWSRFVPLMTRVRDFVKDGGIGDVRHVSADFGLRQTPQSNPRLFDAQNGGALRDLGVYPISLAVDLLGFPSSIDIRQQMEPSGADSRASGVLGYDSGAIATISADIRCQSPTRATIVGTEGFIEIEPPFYRPVVARIHKVPSPKPIPSDSNSRRSGRGRMILDRARRIAAAAKRRLLSGAQVIREPYEGNGYQYQAAEVLRCLSAGKTESSTMPLQHTIETLRVIDLAFRMSESDDPQAHCQRRADHPDATACLSEASSPAIN